MLLNGKEYCYDIDAAHLRKFRTLYKRSPGKALNFLKRVGKEVKLE